MPRANPKRGKYTLPLVTGLIFYFILAVLEPFGTNQSLVTYKPIRIIGFGLITTLLVFIFQSVLPQKFRQFYNPIGWTMKKSVLHFAILLTSMGILNWFYVLIFFPNGPVVTNLWKCIGYTSIIGIFPIVAILIWNYISLLENSSENIISAMATGQERRIRLLGSVKGDVIDLLPSKILLCSAMGNYILVHFMEDGEVQKKMIRKTLKSIAPILPQAIFLKCHRSHIVNMSKVLKHEGNNKGLRLTLSHLDEPIQVSRKYVFIVRRWLIENHISRKSVSK